jgi:uncharacterized protein DUF6789
MEWLEVCKYLERPLPEVRRFDRWQVRSRRWNGVGIVESHERSAVPTAVCGAIGGVIGASCMTVMRALAQRAGYIDKQVPQAVEEWLANRAGIKTPGSPVAHHAVDQVLHLGYGLFLGLIFGLTLGRKRDPRVVDGMLFGVAEWAVGFFAIIPALGVARPAWRSHPIENAVNIATHLVYGAVTAFLTEELTNQRDRGPSEDEERFAKRVG